MSDIPQEPATTPEAEPTPMMEPELFEPSGTASIATHPFAVSEEEGYFAAEQSAVITQCSKLLKLKYTGIILYTNYGDRLLAHWRDAVAEHFKEHVKDEQRGAYALTRKITALGGSPDPSVGKLPSIDAFHPMIMQLLAAEKELIKEARKLAEMAGDNTGLRVMAEELVVTDAHHADDLRRLLLCEA